MKTIVEIKQDLKQFDRKQLYKDKVAKMQRSMADMGIDAVVCFKPQNTFYLSGFNPILYSHPVVVVVPAQGEAVLLVHCGPATPPTRPPLTTSGSSAPGPTRNPLRTTPTAPSASLPAI